MDPARSDLEGYCRIGECKAEPVDDSTRRCFQHAVHFYLHKRDVLPNVKLTQEDEHKRAKLTLELRAHYNAVRSGDTELSSQRQKLTLAWALRDKFKIQWGGAQGLMGMAQVIGDVERLARKHDEPAG